VLAGLRPRMSSVVLASTGNLCLSSREPSQGSLGATFLGELERGRGGSEKLNEQQIPRRRVRIEGGQAVGMALLLRHARLAGQWEKGVMISSSWIDSNLSNPNTNQCQQKRRYLCLILIEHDIYAQVCEVC
jgi:hypothetical protein